MRSKEEERSELDSCIRGLSEALRAIDGTPHLRGTPMLGCLRKATGHLEAALGIALVARELEK